MSSTYIDLINLSEISVDEINVSNINCDSIITTDLTVSGNLTGLITSSSSIFNYSYTPATRTFSISLATQPGIDYILITDSSGIFQSVLFTPLIYPLLSATAPILYDATTGVFSLDTTIAQNETFTGLLTATANTSSTVSRSNQLYNLSASTGTFYLPLVSSLGVGYRDLYNSSAISYNFSTTALTVPIIVNSGTSTFSNGSSAQGAPYSAIFGTASNPSKCAQLALIDGTSSNQYTQLYCRSNTFGVQGNIISISLEKNTTITGTLNVSLGINIPTGQTYKINNVAQSFLNNLTISATSTITHTFASPNLQSNVNDNSITLTKMASSAYNEASIASTLVKRTSSQGIEVGAITCNIIEYSSTSFNPESQVISTRVSTTYPGAFVEIIGYHATKFVSLQGSNVTLGSSGALWDRCSAVNVMEVLMWSKSLLPTFRLEGMLVNFYTAPNTELRINIGVFKNSASTNIFNTATCIASSMVTRNIVINDLAITTFCCFYSEPNIAFIKGTAYTFTLCTQTLGAGVNNIGRALDDIPSHLMVSQIA